MARAALSIPSKHPAPVASPTEPAPVQGSVATARDYRAGRTQISGWIPQEAKRQIDIWAAQNGRTRQWVLEEALNLFFERESLPRLAKMKDD